jgi:Fe-S-cluster containining protein
MGRLQKAEVDQLIELYDDRIRAGVPEATLQKALDRKFAELNYTLYERVCPPIVDRIEAVLAEDPEVVVYASVCEPPYQKDFFIFGKKTIDALMKIMYGCKRCGTCCENPLGERCEHLEDPEAEAKACTLHDKPDYPLICALFPFIISDAAIAGQGRRFKRLSGRKDLSTDYSFGIIDHIALQVGPHHPGWLQGTTTLRELWADAKRKILGWTGPLMPLHLGSDADRDCGFYLDGLRAELSKGEQKQVQ